MKEVSDELDVFRKVDCILCGLPISDLAICFFLHSGGAYNFLFPNENEDFKESLIVELPFLISSCSTIECL